MKTPQQHTSAAPAINSSPIRTHSPYSEAEGPIVDRGSVQARVRAIEGAYKQLWAPPSSERREIHRLPEWKLKGSQPRAASGAPKPHHQADDPFSDVVNQHPADHIQDYVRGPPQPKKSLQHLSSIVHPSPDIYRPDRKSQSLANIRARYEGSPLQGKLGRRINNIGGTSSVESAILSPLPRPVSINSKNIAQGLDKFVTGSLSPERARPSTEARPWSTLVSETSGSDDAPSLEKMRPPRQVPDNTMESFVMENTNDWVSAQAEDQPLAQVQRASTMQAPRRTSSVHTWRAKIRSMSSDQIAKRRQKDYGDIRAAGKAGQNPHGTEERGSSSSNAQLSRSRQSSNASVSASMSTSGALSRAWRKWSGWRLGLADKSSDIAEASGPGATVQETSPSIPEAKAEDAPDSHSKAQSASPVQSPPPQFPKRPVSLTRSQSSLAPAAAHPTTALSSPEVPEWSPTFSRLARSSNSANLTGRTKPALHHTRSAASVIPSPLATRSSRLYKHSPQAASSVILSALAEHDREPTDSTSTGTAYHSLDLAHKGSRQSMRSPWREREQGDWQAEIPLQKVESKSRDQRIKRVKVVVSLDGAGDLIVDAEVQQPGGHGGKVKSFVKRWEAERSSKDI